MARHDEMLSALAAGGAIPGVMGVGPGRTWDAVVSTHAARPHRRRRDVRRARGRNVDRVRGRARRLPRTDRRRARGDGPAPVSRRRGEERRRRVDRRRRVGLDRGAPERPGRHRRPEPRRRRARADRRRRVGDGPGARARRAGRGHRATSHCMPSASTATCSPSTSSRSRLLARRADARRLSP